MSHFNYYRKDKSKETISVEFEGFFKNFSEDERVLIVLPHDDDLNIGAGLMMQACSEKGIPITAAITTDGSMGYCTYEQQKDISKIRTEETLKSIECLGLKNCELVWCGYSDCDLPNHKGRRKAENNSPDIQHGFTGLQNTYTSLFRKVRPTRVFVSTGEDYHPDHKTVYDELLISIFHASGDIWPELGEPLKVVPPIYEMAIYCDFPEPPNLLLKSNEEAFQRKLDSIYAFKSQRQIESVVKAAERNGPYELFREIEFKLYEPKKHIADFGIEDIIKV